MLFCMHLQMNIGILGKVWSFQIHEPEKELVSIWSVAKK